MLHEMTRCWGIPHYHLYVAYSLPYRTDFFQLSIRQFLLGAQIANQGGAELLVRAMHLSSGG